MNDIPPTTSQILLESLEKWTEYRITVVAHTEVGPGPESSPVIVRTDEDGNCTFSGSLLIPGE